MQLTLRLSTGQVEAGEGEVWQCMTCKVGLLGVCTALGTSRGLCVQRVLCLGVGQVEANGCEVRPRKTCILAWQDNRVIPKQPRGVAHS